MKVEQFYNKNQFLIYGEDGTYLQSYNSIVAKIEENGNLILGRDWNYSKTTLKHLYLFLNDEKYVINIKIFDAIKELQNKNNKKAFLQKLIDKNIIGYNENL